MPVVVGIAARAIGALAGRGLMAAGMSEGAAAVGEGAARGGAHVFGNQMVAKMNEAHQRTQRATM